MLPPGSRVSRFLGTVSPPSYREDAVARFLGVEKPGEAKQAFLDSFARLGADALVDRSKGRRDFKIKRKTGLVGKIKDALREKVALIDVELLTHPEGVKQAFAYASLAKQLPSREKFKTALLLARFYRSRYLYRLSELGERELASRIPSSGFSETNLIIPERLRHQLRREEREGFLNSYAESAERRAKKDVFEYFFMHPIGYGLDGSTKLVLSHSADAIESGLTDVRTRDLREKLQRRHPLFDFLYDDRSIRWRRLLYTNSHSPNVLGLVEREAGLNLDSESVARALNAISRPY